MFIFDELFLQNNNNKLCPISIYCQIKPRGCLNKRKVSTYVDMIVLLVSLG